MHKYQLTKHLNNDSIWKIYCSNILLHLLVCIIFLFLTIKSESIVLIKKINGKLLIKNIAKNV